MKRNYTTKRNANGWREDNRLGYRNYNHQLSTGAELPASMLWFISIIAIAVGYTLYAASILLPALILGKTLFKPAILPFLIIGSTLISLNFLMSGQTLYSILVITALGMVLLVSAIISISNYEQRQA